MLYFNRSSKDIKARTISGCLTCNCCNNILFCFKQYFCKFCESLLPSVVNLFLVTELHGGDGPGYVPHVIFLSWRTPQPNIRTFQAVARRWMLTSDRNLHPAHFAPTCGEEGLRPIEGQTLDHQSYQWEGRTAWQADGQYTALIQQWSSVLFVLLSCLEPLAIQTLLVAVAIVTKEKDLFRWCTQNARHFLALNVCFLIFVCVRVCVLMQ